MDEDQVVEFNVDEDQLDGGADAATYMADALLESVLGPKGVHAISTRDAFCLVVQAPAADWVAPLHRSIRRMGYWQFHLNKTENKRQKTDDNSDKLVDALTAGGRVMGVSHRPQELLPRAMLTAADQFLKVPMPSPRLLGQVIRAVTGDLPIDVPHTLGQGLSFDELVSCIRRKSTAAESVDRIRRAMAAKQVTSDFGDDVPLVRDLSGMGDAKLWAEELVADIEDWRNGEIAFREIGSAAAVIAGPPGTGKTALMRSISKSTGLPLIATSVGAWFSSSPGFLDSIVKKIDEVFASARAAAPSILYLDELDAVPSRASISPRGADWWLPVITHLLTTIDGAANGNDEQIVLVAATNHPERLDAALIRPGRFSRIIEVGPPDAEGMAGILRQHLGKDLEGVDLTDAANMAGGATGARAVEWVRAARRSARLAKRTMVIDDLVDVIAPPELRPAELLWRTAVHESGHAVAASVLGLGRITAISIVPAGSNGGYTTLERHEGRQLSLRKDVEDLVVQTLSGRAAEEVVTGTASTGSGGALHSDLSKSTRAIGLLHLGTGLGTDLLYRAGPEEVSIVLATDPRIAAEIETELRHLYARALELMDRERQAVERVARDLVERRHIGADRFLELMVEDKVAPRRKPSHGRKTAAASDGAAGADPMRAR